MNIDLHDFNGLWKPLSDLSTSIAFLITHRIAKAKFQHILNTVLLFDIHALQIHTNHLFFIFQHIQSVFQFLQFLCFIYFFLFSCFKAILQEFQFCARFQILLHYRLYFSISIGLIEFFVIDVKFGLKLDVKFYLGHNGLIGFIVFHQRLLFTLSRFAQYRLINHI